MHPLASGDQEAQEASDMLKLINHSLQLLEPSFAKRNWPKKIKNKKSKKHTLVVSNLRAERLLLQTIAELPILQPKRNSAVGSCVCITKHVLSPAIA